MFDLHHQFGTDFAVGATGDLSSVDGTVLSQQRLLRRLLTNPGDYIWHTDYGAGLAQFVGRPADASRIRAVIRSQIFKESTVAKTPEPMIEVQSDTGGIVFVQVRYADASSGATQLLSFTLSDEV
jgi:phage baseplate assembly protein W